MKDKLVKNVLFGFGGQLIIIILGIIVPKIILTSYGSDVNGLLSTITQIFTYMALLEAGIGQAAKNALYKPMANGDKDGISEIMTVAQNYFRKVTCYYGIGVVALSVVSPFILKSNVDKPTIFLVIFFEGLSGVISFYFIESISTMLIADGRGYLNNGINVVNRTLSYIVKIVMAICGYNIAVVQFVYLIITIAKVFVYKLYFKKYYQWIDFKKDTKEEKLKDKNSYVITELAWTMFSSTDMIVLSIFVSTQLSSVYAIYNIIFSNLSVLLNSVYSSVTYVLGRTYHENIRKYEIVHDSFTSIFMGTMTVLMAVAYLLCIPFVKLYTQGIDDIEYIYKMLPLLFCLVQLLSWSRYVSGNLSGLAGYAKETSKVSLVEAITNIVLSIALVNTWGIVGVLLATVVALPLKIFWCIYIADKKVMKRSYKKTLSILGINYLFFGLVVYFERFLEIRIGGYLSFIIYGIAITSICGFIGLGLNFLVNPSSVFLIKNFLNNRSK